MVVSVPDFPDVKLFVMRHLRSAVDVPVVSTRPDDGKTVSFVRVIATGGPGRHDRVLQTVQVTVDSYAASAGAAATLAARVDDAVHDMVRPGAPVAAVPWGTSPQDYPDPDTGSARYTATYQLVVKRI